MGRSGSRRHGLVAWVAFSSLTFGLFVQSAQALNPGHEAVYQSGVERLHAQVEKLNEKVSVAFAPGSQSEGGLEEVAWRVRDIREKTRTLQNLSKAYWKNETQIVGVMDQWQQDAKLMDEVMLYASVTKDVSGLWQGVKESATVLRDLIEEVPAAEEWSSVMEQFGFEIVKVGRYEKKEVLREKIKTFVGSSELDKWPFPDERRDLDPKQVGEHYLVRFKLHPKSSKVLDLPLKLRFEYKFAKHQYDGQEITTYVQLRGGSHNFLFKNIGEAFTQKGKILHWRASLLLMEKVVAQKKSPMWTVASQWATK